MSDYKCGHNRETHVINSDPLTVAAYLTWASTCGYDGDKSMCASCWGKEQRKLELRVRP